MSDFIHCNRCMATKNVKFMLGQCFHVNCERCVMKEPSRMCPVCKKVTKYVPVDALMPDSLKIYFANPTDLFQKELAKLQKQYDFQNGMTTHLLEHMKRERERIKKMEHIMRSKHREEENMKKELEAAKQWIEQAEKSMKKQEEEKADLLRQISELEGCGFNGIPDQTSKFKFFESETDSQLSSIQSSNSSFNIMSPIVRSPPPVESQMFDDRAFAKPFLTPKTPESKQFVKIFNNMITPSRQFPKVPTTNSTIADKTSFSLGDRTSILHSSERARRETSLPQVSSTYSSSSSKYARLSNDFLSQRERQFPSEIRELRRNASQKGIVTRNSIIPASYLNLDG